jgi:hypothetical protein
MVTGTTLVLLAPAATGAPGKAPNLAPSHPKAAKQTARSSRTGPSGAPQQVYVAPFPSRPITSPRYIYIPANAANVPVVVEDCESSGNDCSDQELCDIWGLNCPAPPSPLTTGSDAPNPS